MVQPAAGFGVRIRICFGGIAFMPDSEPPVAEEEEFEPDAPELEESAQPTDGPDLLWGRFLDDMIDDR